MTGIVLTRLWVTQVFFQLSHVLAETYPVVNVCAHHGGCLIDVHWVFQIKKLQVWFWMSCQEQVDMKVDDQSRERDRECEGVRRSEFQFPKQPSPTGVESPVQKRPNSGFFFRVLRRQGMPSFRVRGGKAWLRRVLGMEKPILLQNASLLSPDNLRDPKVASRRPRPLSSPTVICAFEPSQHRSPAVWPTAKTFSCLGHQRASPESPLHIPIVPSAATPSEHLFLAGALDILSGPLETTKKTKQKNRMLLPDGIVLCENSSSNVVIYWVAVKALNCMQPYLRLRFICPDMSQELSRSFWGPNPPPS